VRKKLPLSVICVAGPIVSWLCVYVYFTKRLQARDCLRAVRNGSNRKISFKTEYESSNPSGKLRGYVHERSISNRFALSTEQLQPRNEYVE